MDYQTQQAKLFTPLALAFSFHFAGQTLWQSYNEVQDQMESGGNFERLPELHALACGLKALVTHEAKIQLTEIQQNKRDVRFA